MQNMLNYIYSHFSFNGRISKKEMNHRWRNNMLAGMVLGIVFIPAFLIVSQLFGGSSSTSAGVMLLLPFAFLLFLNLASIFVRRGHDRNRTGWIIYVYLCFLTILFAGSGYKFVSGHAGLCRFIPASLCDTSAYQIEKWVEQPVFLILNILLIIFIVECYKEGPVEGAERFGKGPED